MQLIKLIIYFANTLCVITKYTYIGCENKVYTKVNRCKKMS